MIKKDYADPSKYLLTDKQADVYRLIVQNPSISFVELAKEIGVSVGAIQAVIHALEKKKYLKSSYKTNAFEI